MSFCGFDVVVQLCKMLLLGTSGKEYKGLHHIVCKHLMDQRLLQKFKSQNDTMYIYQYICK